MKQRAGIRRFWGRESGVGKKAKVGKIPGCPFGAGLSGRVDVRRSFMAQVVTSCKPAMTAVGYFMGEFSF